MPGLKDAFRGIAFQGDAGDDFRFQLTVLCKDGATAEQYGKMGDGLLSAAKMNQAALPPGATKILDSVRISYSGSTLHATATIDVRHDCRHAPAADEDAAASPRWVRAARRHRKASRDESIWPSGTQRTDGKFAGGATGRADRTGARS